MASPNKQHRRRGLIVTIIFHIILAIVFYFVGLTQPDPIPEEIGVEIAMADFGSTMDGAGDIQPDKISEPSEEQVQETNPVDASPVPTSAAEEVTTDDASEIAVPKSTAKKPTKKEATEAKPKPEPEPVKPTVNQNALYKKKAGSTTSGGSQGDGSGIGDKGSPDGGPGKGALGGGSGSWELSGRSLLRGATIADTKEEGTVVLDIFVDRNGRVTRTSPNLAKSTTTSQYLFDLAAKAAKQTKYSSKSDAAIEQKGKMTFVFILK